MQGLLALSKSYYNCHRGTTLTTVSRLAHSRQTLRMLQDVSAGTRAKFQITGSQPKRASRGSKTKTTTPKTNGITKAKRTQSQNARANVPSPHEEDVAVASSSAAAPKDDDANAMDDMPTETVATKAASASTEDVEFEYAVPTRLSRLPPC